MEFYDPDIMKIFAEMGETVPGMVERLQKNKRLAFEIIFRRMVSLEVEINSDTGEPYPTKENIDKLTDLLIATTLLGVTQMELFQEYRENYGPKSDLN